MKKLIISLVTVCLALFAMGFAEKKVTVQSMPNDKNATVLATNDKTSEEATKSTEQHAKKHHHKKHHKHHHKTH